MQLSLSSKQIKSFNSLLYAFFSENGRQLPWRTKRIRPYHIFISEIMLQQTQVERVVPKFTAFIRQFPSFNSLATAQQKDVLKKWQGLGYNRRALFLHKAAQIVTKQYKSRLPHDPNILKNLPGIGKATAASICAFAFNSPTIFIETNIRSVFIHHFFSDNTNISDSSLLPIIEQTIDKHQPSRWYSALMDYGVFLKKTHKNPSRRSQHHHLQSAFAGSDRKIRGEIIRYLSYNDTVTKKELMRIFSCTNKRLDPILNKLQKEKLIFKKEETYYL